jgi:hypothetical protein
MTASSKLNYAEILKAAMAQKGDFLNGPGVACGRVYVAISKEHRAGIRAAAKKLGVRYLGIESQCPHALYIGYDNATGVELSKGAKVAAALKAAGIGAYRDEYGD